jgi:hypothetical protein
VLVKGFEILWNGCSKVQIFWKKVLKDVQLNFLEKGPQRCSTKLERCSQKFKSASSCFKKGCLKRTIFDWDIKSTLYIFLKINKNHFKFPSQKICNKIAKHHKNYAQNVNKY